MTWSTPKDLASQHVAVIGAGTLGRRVALVWASKGGSVKIVDTKEEATKETLKWVQDQLPEQAKAVKGTPGQVSVATDNESACKNAWMVVECTPELQQLKIDLLGQLDSCCDPSTIVATISSSFKSGELIEKVNKAGRIRILNTHYFQPPELPPVEIMSCGATDPAIIEFLKPRLREISLDPIVVAVESTGLLYNRIWAALKREIMLVLAEEVGTPQDIDKLFRYSFQSQGAPCDLMDKVGLQTVCNIEEHYVNERGNIPHFPVDYIREKYVDKGHLGVATGQGLFDHHTDHKEIENTSRKQSLRHQLIGAWELVEYSAFPSSNPSNKVYPMGRDAQGIIMYTHTGYMSAQLQIPGQPKFKSDDSSGGSAEELAEAGKNYLAYTVPFYLDESGDQPLLQHHMTNCSFPNWLGNTQRRLVNIRKKGDEQYLTLGPEGEMPIMGKNRVAQLVWRKLPENHATAPVRHA
ncbi:hypothetical protein MMC10_001413 [Thelotrema lepadinum]|nr:hypothetical protein [Thelotrema lepadinum]